MATGHTTRVPLTHLSLPLSSSASSSLSNPSAIFTKNLVLRQSRKHPKLIYCCKEDNLSNITSEESVLATSAKWDWNRWTTHFAHIQQAENFASFLKFQLEEAIEKEDFREAANLKKSLAEVTEKDSIAEILSQLKTAINEERYHDASRLSQSTGSGLIGWWVGYSKDSEDPFGKVVRITPGMGRFVAKTYSPRELVTASPGTPLFEIFVVKDADDTYTLQVAYLHQSRRGKTNISSPLDPKPMNDPSANEIENDSAIDVKVTENEAKKAEDKMIDFEGAAEEGIKSVINFLKKKIPELKVNMKITITDEIAEDIESMKQVMEDDNRSTVSSEDEDSEDEVNDLDGTDPDEVAAGSDSVGDEKGQDMKLFIGGLIHNKEDNPTKEEFCRIPAGIKDIERDSFMLHIPKRYQDHSTDKISDASAEVAAAAAQSFSELMPPDVAKAFWTSDKVSPKVSRDVREIVKLAFKQAQKRNTFSEYTTFNRIITTGGDSDPFEGLYIGAFGPYGAEVVQLRHKYGNWNAVDTDEPTNTEFYEYVEAVKLTGDLNVPAGQVTFRAKILRGNRHSNRGKYPDELGVLASYKGEGRIADFGFKSPRWVEGELLQLHGKGLGPYVRGADLGFLYVVPDQSFLVLFNRLKLPE
ncbi:hypothetical protein LIER_03418 [Lithospermum erythrorhizon]|uniref:Protein EXECUTER 2, chloroplastic n=1 Tax=Lithospermum erythrorhizon TaxID=34254 RepID=A0AAV3NXU3_LITER